MAGDRTALDQLEGKQHRTGSLERQPIPASRKRTPFTSGARSVLPRALAEVRKTGSRRITPEHLLLALLECERPDPTAELMSELGIDRAAVRERIRQASA